MEYKIRPSILYKNPLTYELTDDAMHIHEEGKASKSIPYKDIVKINPAYTPTKNNRNLYTTTIIQGNGQKTRLTNQEYKGFADFGDRSEDYTKFITALHLKSHHGNPAIQYIRGNSAGLYYTYAFIYIVSLVIFGLLGIFSIVFFNIITGIVALIGFISIYPTTKKHFKFNKPLQYPIHEVPAGLLPGI